MYVYIYIYKAFFTFHKPKLFQIFLFKFWIFQNKIYSTFVLGKIFNFDWSYTLPREMWIHLDTMKPIITTRIPDETPARKRRISPSSLNSILFFILPGAGFLEYWWSDTFPGMDSTSTRKEEFNTYSANYWSPFCIILDNILILLKIIL